MVIGQKASASIERVQEFIVVFRPYDIIRMSQGIVGYGDIFQSRGLNSGLLIPKQQIHPPVHQIRSNIKHVRIRETWKDICNQLEDGQRLSYTLCSVVKTQGLELSMCRRRTLNHLGWPISTVYS
jgi:hypothetical protein